MVYYLIVCRSLTYAQRTALALNGPEYPPMSFDPPKSSPVPDAAIR